MNFALTEEQAAMREAIVRFARERLNGDVAARDRSHEFRRDLWLACGEMGLHGLPVPVEYGGSGLDALTSAVALDAFGYGCEDGGLVFAVCAHLVSCAVPLWKHGTGSQRKHYLPDLCCGRLIGVHAMTEPGSGSDAFGMATVARPDGDGFRIAGTKTFISNGPIADVVIVFALTDRAKGYHGGTTAFLVEAGTPGFTVGAPIEKMGLRTAPMCELIFDEVRVGPDAVVGGIGGGARVFADAMDWERVLLFASHVGTLERLLDRAVTHARTRSQFGQLIGKFQAVSHKIADMKVRLDAARLLVYRGAWELAASRTPGMVAAVAKLFTSEALVETALETVQVLGGYGFTTEYGVERTLRDAIGATLYSGTSEMQRNIIARWLGL